jgi:Zn-finger nucleic acid-binding protein
MKSPVHPETDLVPQEIEPGLAAYVCPISGGVWIPLQSFLAWKTAQPASMPPAAAPAAAAIAADDSTRRTLICPESGRLLIRYRVGHGLPFHVDQSPVTGGVWLDQGEWEALKARGLHVHLNEIFTASYQRKVRSEEYHKSVESAFQQRIGEGDFQKVTAFKSWVATHPKRRDILCYLTETADSDPE